MCRNRMCNNFIVEGIYKKDPLINPSVTANASHVRHNDFQRPNRIFTSQIFDDLKLLPLPVTNSFCEPLPFTRYPFFSRATSASSFAIRSCNWPISSNVLLVCSAAYRLPHRSRCDARPASHCSAYSFIQRSNILKLSPCSFANFDWEICASWNSDIYASFSACVNLRWGFPFGAPMISTPFLLLIIQKSRHHQKLAFFMVSTFILQMQLLYEAPPFFGERFLFCDHGKRTFDHTWGSAAQPMAGKK